MNLIEKSNELRDEVIRIAVKNNAGHLASSLSCHDILVALYYNIMTEDDHCILSKAHGCYSLYAILADKGKLPKDQWKEFNTKESILTGCASYKPEWGIEAGCGSLGHGLPIAVGMAYAMELQYKKGIVYCIVGDGELEEGTTWESLNFIKQNSINNICIIIDGNELRALDNIVIRYNREFFNYVCQDDIELIINGIYLINKMKPEVKILNVDTIKGKGLKCMENKPEFHFRVPTDKELEMGKTY